MSFFVDEQKAVNDAVLFAVEGKKCQITIWVNECVNLGLNALK